MRFELSPTPFLLPLSRSRTATIAALAGLSILAALVSPMKAQAATDGTCASGLTPVQTISGPVCGTVISVGQGKVQAYRGMPYATAGRWQDPMPYGQWNGTYDANTFGPICPQKSGDPNQSEECLSINVWRPAGGDNLPVMLFIYGGAFIEGFSSSPLLDGSHLAIDQQAVVVSFNYRLGALGFLAGSFSDNTTLNGNFGFKDQQTAMRWVHDNISNFGGNAGNVTLFGESAGAMSVGLHLLSAPASKSLFQQAIMESNPLSLPYKTPDEAAPFATSLANALGCATGGLACMKGVSYQAIVDAQGSKDVVNPATDQGFVDFLVWAPILDGKIIKSDPIKGKLDKPTLFGTNLNEGNLFVDLIKSQLGCTPIYLVYKDLILKSFFGKTIADQVARQYPIVKRDGAAALSKVLNDYIFTCSHRYLAGQAKDPSQLWAYQFRPLTTYDIYRGGAPDCVQNSSSTVQSPICHGDELPYVFNSWNGVGVTPSANETGLTSAIMGYWGSFAAAGAPKGAVTWTSFGSPKNYLLLTTPPSGQADPFQSICGFWDTIGYDLRKVPSSLFKSLQLGTTRR